MTDVTRLSEDAYRAEYLFNAQSDVAAANNALMEDVAAYADANGLDKLPEDVCGPVAGTMATLALGFIVGVYPTADAQESDADVDPETAIRVFMATNECVLEAKHAAEHGDVLGQIIVNSASPWEAYDGIVSWVSEHLEGFEVPDDASLLSDLIGLDF